MRKVKANSLQLAFLALLLGVVLVFHGYAPVNAMYLSQRSVTIATSQINAVTSHQFLFTIPSTNAVGSIKFEYCTNSPLMLDPCAAPGGMDVTAASITTQVGETGFSMHPNTTFNSIVISRPSVATVVGSNQYVFDNITNPATASITVYVRMSTYVTTDATGPLTDEGSVAFSTSGGLGVGGFVPPYLRFCAAVIVSEDCTTMTGQLIGFGEFSTSATSSATSQFAISTNDPTGFGVYLSGQTMTAGNITIPGLVAGGTSQTGVSQFGINLRANTVPSLGGETTGVGTGVPSAGYGTQNNYRFGNGERIAESPIPTEPNRFTVSYIVNIAPEQKSGFYATTITYIATVSF